MTAKPFFVTGLPRSRTAWAAVWLSTDKSQCFHDRSAEEPLPITKPFWGISGPELVFDYDTLEKAYPDAPWLVIERKPDDAFIAFKKAARHHLPPDGPTLREVWKQRLSAYGTLLNKPHVFAITMDELDQQQMAQAAWKHLLPGLPFDYGRWFLLRTLNIQQKIEQVIREKGESWQSLPLLAQ